VLEEGHLGFCIADVELGTAGLLSEDLDRRLDETAPEAVEVEGSVLEEEDDGRTWLLEVLSLFEACDARPIALDRF
jgi:hypothetical protein